MKRTHSQVNGSVTCHKGLKLIFYPLKNEEADLLCKEIVIVVSFTLSKIREHVNP